MSMLANTRVRLLVMRRLANMCEKLIGGQAEYTHRYSERDNVRELYTCWIYPLTIYPPRI